MLSSSHKSSVEFSDLYITYYPKLLRFARQYVVSEEDAKNLVQDVFLKLWEIRDSLPIIENMNAYLFRLIKNRCLNHLQHVLFVEKYANSMKASYQTELSLKLQALDKYDDALMSEEEIEKIISDAINKLPEKCREIFILSRYEELRYKEISDRLGISLNTVENQISIALKKLRVFLGDYMKFFLFFI